MQFPSLQLILLKATRRVRSKVQVSRSKRGALGLLGLALAFTLSSCSEPSKIYSKNQQLGVFFTVPNGWYQIPEEEIRSYEVEGADAAAKTKADLVLWQEAYSESKETSAKNLLQLEAPKALTAFARVRALTVEESDAMSYNGLRNLILPVTDLITGQSQIVDEFQLLDEKEVVGESARGLETVFSFTPKGGTNETVHQTALLANDRRSIYFFLVRCTTECFNESEKSVSEIVKSFTVKGNR